MMSTSKTCINGHACPFLKTGTCKFNHSSDIKSTVSKVAVAPVAHRTPKQTLSGSRRQGKFLSGVKKPNRETLFQSLKPLLKSVRQNLDSKDALVKKYNVDMASYFDVKTSKDVKMPSTNSLFDRELKVLEDELAALRNTARSLLKGWKGQNKNLLIDFYQTYQINSTGGTGSSFSNTSLDPSALTEFASAAILFDEYRVEGFQYHYHPYGILTIAAGTTNINGFGIIAYDPSDDAPPTSITTLAQNEQHQMFKQTMAVSSTVSTTASSLSALHVFKARVPKGVLQGSSTTLSEWQPTTLDTGHPAYLPYGWIKQVSLNYNTTSTAIIGGMLVYNVQFRMRE